MNFLDKLVLPQSLEHTTLLHFLLMVVLFMFIPFLSLVLGGSLLSLFYRNRSKSSGNLYFERFSKEIIELVTINKSIGLALGLAPFVMLIMTYTQLLHTLDLRAVQYFVMSFALTTVGLVLLYTYRYSSYFSGLLQKVVNTNVESEDSAVKEYSHRVGRLYDSSGRWGLFFILIGTFFLSAGFVFGLRAPALTTPSSFWDAFTCLAVYTQWLYLLASAIALSAGLVIFNYFFWEGGRKIEDEYAAFVKENAFKAVFVFALVQPLLLMVNVNFLPTNGLSFAVFALPVLAVALIFAALHMVYQMIKNKNVSFSGSVFVLLYMVSFFVILAEQTALSNATTKNSLVLGAAFDDYKKTLVKAGAGTNTVSGEEIYKTKCSACHKFDVKLVGPPYKETLVKYDGKMAKLQEFIANPVKVNPAYPPMPAQGLKPAEVRAIAKYIMEEYKKLK